MTMTMGTHSKMAHGHDTISTAIVYRRAPKPAWLESSSRTRNPTTIQTTKTIAETARITGTHQPAARSTRSWMGRCASCWCATSAMVSAIVFSAGTRTTFMSTDDEIGKHTSELQSLAYL